MSFVIIKEKAFLVKLGDLVEKKGEANVDTDEVDLLRKNTNEEKELPDRFKGMKLSVE